MINKPKIPPIKTEKEQIPMKWSKYKGWVINKDTNETIIK